MAQPLGDPSVVRALGPFLVGAATALLSVWLTFFLRSKWELFRALRAVQAELDRNADLLAELAELLADDLTTQHVDLPVEVPADSTLEVRYVVSFPGALSTTAFEQLTQSGRFLDLPPEVQRTLYDLYGTIDRINRLRQHREDLHFDHVGNVHVVVDTSDLDVEPGVLVHEEDLPPETRARLEDLRELRRAMRGVNVAILRLVATVAPPATVEDLELAPYLDPPHGRGPGQAADDAGPGPQSVDVEEGAAMLADLRNRSLWARFV